MNVSIEDLERRVTERLRCEDYDEATTIAFRALGPEILGLFVSLMRDADAAQDALSMFAEDLWLGLPSFQGRSSIRTWAYRVARNALHRHRTRVDKNAGKNLPLSAVSRLSAIAEELRTSTATFLENENKARARELRARLSEDDQLVLVLRVDRDMSFDEIAEVLAAAPLSDEERKRRSAAARQRFASAKRRLRDLFVAEGLLRGND